MQKGIGNQVPRKFLLPVYQYFVSLCTPAFGLVLYIVHYTFVQLEAKLNTKICLSHHNHHHTTTPTTNFLTSCRHSRNLKLGTHLKDDIKKEFLENNSNV